MIVNNSSLPTVGFIPAQDMIPPATRKADTLWEKVKSTASKIFAYFQDIIWKYIEEANYLAQNVISIISEVCKSLQNKLNSIISKMGILSAISCIFSIKSVPSTVESLIEHVKTKDGEGVAFSVLSLISSPFEFLDSLTTTMGALAAFGVIPAIAFFGLIGLPLAIGLTGYAAFKGLYDIIRCSIHYHQLPRYIDNHNIDKVRQSLKEKIGVTDKEKEKLRVTYASLKTQCSEAEYNEKIQREIKIIKDRKRNILSRHTDEKIYNMMKNLKKELKTGPADLTTSNEALKDIKKLMVRKISWDSTECGLNIAYLVTLAASAVFPISAFAIPAVGGIKSTMAIAKHHYMHAWFDKGLNLPHFAKEA